MDRRTFIASLGAALGTVGIGHFAARALSGDDKSQSRTGDTPKRRAPSLEHEVDGLPTAAWLIEENARRGTRGWVISPRHTRHEIEGYVNAVSVTQGEELTLFVTTTSPTWVAQVFRMGYYAGHGARLIHVTPELPGHVQPAPTVTPGINMVECQWKASRAFAITEDWLPGYYLIRLVGSGGQLRFVPFLVRDDSSKSTFAVQSSVTTWQAYNQWGGYSLYGGVITPTKNSFDNRSRIVSFDRPYTPSPLALDAQGSGDFLGNEFPFVYLAERLGLDVTYWTDVDLHLRPQLLSNHRCFVSLGHDEYWSTPMRDGAEQALKSGVNLAFLGANACYRQIRLAQSPNGPNRHVICYKDASEDPITKSNPALATGGSWATDPIPRPESQLIGVMYQSYGANAPLVIADASSFVFKGTGLSNHDKVIASAKANVVGSEFDGFEPRLAPVENVTILAHSPTQSVSGALASDMSYFTMSGGGGVFATGTSRWVQLLWNGDRALDNALSFGVSPAVETLTTITLNALRVLSTGPASRTHPSVANWQSFYTKTAPIHLGIDVGGH